MNLITGCRPKNIPEIRTACFPVTDHSLQMSSSPPVSVLLKTSASAASELTERHPDGR